EHNIYYRIDHGKLFRICSHRNSICRPKGARPYQPKGKRGTSAALGNRDHHHHLSLFLLARWRANTSEERFSLSASPFRLQSRKQSAGQFDPIRPRKFESELVRKLPKFPSENWSSAVRLPAIKKL